DWWLMFLAMALCAIGVAAIFSATRGTGANTHMRQLSWVGVGLVAMLILSRIDYHKLIDSAPILYLSGLSLLVLVLFIGITRHNTKGWLPLGGFELQVAEPVKLIIIIVLARFFSEVRTDRLSLADLAKATALTALPVALIMKQPDFGTAMMILPALAIGAFLAGIQWKHAIAGMVIVAMLLPVGWLFLKPYQKQRIQTFLNPEDNPQGAGYQTLQAKIAVGSGGLTGKGFGKGTQNQLGFVPVPTSDFVFSTLAEEWGFVGVFLTLGMYTALLIRLVLNARKAVDRSGMFLVMGVAAILGVHIFWNVAMVIGYAPVTGIPLPLMSYGGSATLFVFMALGLVMNVRINRFVN
ncbi:MAG: rod shape-determining protein RodA, partial [Acidobacteria bacterium]|nr:rod shape-determining protein RodA [Acidobacteriota bacterium]